MKSTRILCVEDDQDNCEMLKAFLGEAGYEVKTAGNPGDSLIMVRAGGYDLIILDSLYPEETGAELCRRIRAFDERTPIIFYSGLGQESDINEALDAGAQAYVIKPYVDDLLVEVKRLTERAATPS